MKCVISAPVVTSKGDFYTVTTQCPSFDRPVKQITPKLTSMAKPEVVIELLKQREQYFESVVVFTLFRISTL